MTTVVLNMESLLQRFCRYVRIDTAAVESSTSYPSSPGQTVLAHILEEELRSFGIRDVTVDEHSIVQATIPSNLGRPAPVIAWIAHMDTSPETSGHNVNPMVHRNYAGQDIVLPGNTAKVLRPAENPELAAMTGQDHHHDRRHHAAGGGRQGRHRHHHGSGRASSGSSRSAARRHPHLLHLR